MTTPSPLTRRTRCIGTIACIAALVLLGACREEEQDRLKSFEPGVYQGVEDSTLDQETVDALRNRALRNTDP